MYQQPSAKLLPVKSPAFFRQSIVYRAARKQQSLFLELPIIIRVFCHIGPDRKHEMHMLPVQCLDHFPGRRKSFRIEGFLSPLIVFPGTPVKNNTVQSNTSSSVFGSHLQNFFLCLVSFLTLYISESPFGKQCRFSRKMSVFPDHLVHGSAMHHIEIHLCIRFRIQIRPLYRIVKNHRAVGIHQNAVSTGRYQHGNGNLSVGLMHINLLSSQRTEAFFMLSKSVQCLLVGKFQVKPGMETTSCGFFHRLFYHFLHTVRGNHLLCPDAVFLQFIDSEFLQYLTVSFPFSEKTVCIPVQVRKGAGCSVYPDL